MDTPLYTTSIVNSCEPAYTITDIEPIEVRNMSQTFQAGGLQQTATWETFGSHGSSAGYRVSPYTSLGISAVWQAVTLISGDIAKLPVYLYFKDNNESPQKVTTHPGWKVAGRRPSQSMDFNVFQFWRRVLIFFLLYNRTWVWIQRNGFGQPIGLWPLLPGQTYSSRMSGESSRPGDLMIHSVVGDQLLSLYPEEVLYLEGISLDNEEAEIFVHHAREAFGLAIAQQAYASRFFKAGGRVGGILELPVEIKPEAKDRLEDGFRKTYESIDSAFKTVVLRDNAKFHPGQHSPQESQMAEARREQVREVARRFNLHPSRLGEEAKSSYGSKSEDNRDYLDMTLSPILCQIATELSHKLLTDRQFQSGSYYFEHDTDRMLMLDAVKRSQIYSMGIKDTWMNPNEARQKESMPKREGGDDFGNPNTSSPHVKETAATEDVAPAKTTSDAVIATTRRLLSSTISRTLKVASQKAVKAAKHGNGFISWTELEMPTALRAVSDASCEVIDTFLAFTGSDTKGLQMYLFSQICIEVSEMLNTVCDSTCAEDLPNAVFDVFESYLESAPDNLAALVIK